MLMRLSKHLKSWFSKQNQPFATALHLLLAVISSDKTPLTGADSVAWKMSQKDFVWEK
jgi:hypothetical protein